MVRRGHTRTRGTSAVRPVEWFRGFTVLTTVVGAAGASSAAAFLLLGAAGTAFAAAISPTIVRIRGSLAIVSDVTTGLGFWSAGFVKMSAKAFSVGITAVPIPSVDDADWQWYSSGGLGDSAAITSTPGEEDVVHIDIDSKAMRKFQQDDDVFVFVFANNTGIAGDDISFRLGFSILIKE